VPADANAPTNRAATFPEAEKLLNTGTSKPMDVNRMATIMDKTIELNFLSGVIVDIPIRDD
jgi:hypothetical protein